MKGVVLVNLGSPESTNVKDVKSYLNVFLMDKYVIDFPYLLRAFLVKGVILGLRNRSKKSAEAYRTIWWNNGSPLIVLSKKLHQKVQEKNDIPIVLAMRYGNPSIKSALEELNKKDVKNVLVIPLYPQYAMATTLTSIKEINKIQQKYFKNIKLNYFSAFYNRKEYIKALSESIKKHLNGFDYEKLIFSYHGLPERHIQKVTKDGTHRIFINNQYCCDPNSSESKFCYRTQCFETTRQVVAYLNIDKNKVINSFQSRLSGEKWLQPYTDKEIEVLAKNGAKKIAVVTPSFVSDCLETLEEIGVRAKENFTENGGTELFTIPCLNEDPLWVDAICTWIEEK